MAGLHITIISTHAKTKKETSSHLFRVTAQQRLVERGQILLFREILRAPRSRMTSSTRSGSSCHSAVAHRHSGFFRVGGLRDRGGRGELQLGERLDEARVEGWRAEGGEIERE